MRRIDQVSDSEIEIIPLQHAAAAEVVRVLTSLTRARPAAAKGQAAVSGGEVLVADERYQQRAAGRGSRHAPAYARDHLAPGYAARCRWQHRCGLYLRYAEATALVETLTGVGKIEEQQDAAGKARTARSEFAIQADEATNALVITAPPDIMRSLKRVISQLDVRRAQVLIEAVIAEVSGDVARELGVQWLFNGAQGWRWPGGPDQFHQYRQHHYRYRQQCCRCYRWRGAPEDGG